MFREIIEFWNFNKNIFQPGSMWWALPIRPSKTSDSSARVTRAIIFMKLLWSFWFCWTHFYLASRTSYRENIQRLLTLWKSFLFNLRTPALSGHSMRILSLSILYATEICCAEILYEQCVAHLLAIYVVVKLKERDGSKFARFIPVE